MVLKYTKKDSNAWYYIEGDMIRVNSIIAKDLFDKMSDEGANSEEYFIAKRSDAIMNVVYPGGIIPDHKRLWYLENIWKTSRICAIHVQSVSKETVIVWDSDSYVGYLLNDKGSTIERVS